MYKIMHLHLTDLVPVAHYTSFISFPVGPILLRMRMQVIVVAAGCTAGLSMLLFQVYTLAGQYLGQ